MRYFPLFWFCSVLIFFTPNANAQKDPFEHKLNTINSLLDNHRPQDAEKAIDLLLSNPENRTHSTRYLAALRYKIRVHAALSENSIHEVWNFLDSLLQQASPFEKSILHVYKIQLIETYTQENIYRLSDITDTDDEDIPLENRSLTWWRDTLLSEMKLALTSNAAENKTMPLDGRRLLFSEYNHWAQQALPSLWDVIADEILRKMTSDYGILWHLRHNIKDPRRYMVPAKEFISLDLSAEDLSPQEVCILSLFKEIFENHIDKSDDAVCFWEYRLYDHLILSDKNIDISERIKYTHERYMHYKGKTPLAGEWLYREMLCHTTQPCNEDPAFPNYPKALELIEEGIRDYGTTPVSNDFYAQKSSITQQNIDVIFEKATVPDKESMIKVSYRNVDTLFLQIYTIPEEYALEFCETSIPNSERMKRKLNKFPHRLVRLPLPKFTDYETHSTCVILPPLPQGLYVAQVANVPNSHEEYGQLDCFWKTNLVPVFQKTTTNDETLCCYDRRNDKTVPNVKISFYETNHNAHKMIPFEKKHHTDENGACVLDDLLYQERNFLVKLEIKDDYFITDVHLFGKINEKLSDTVVNLSIFTDRAVYRPGQKVSFKVIADAQKHVYRKILENTDLKVLLQNVNEENIAEQVVRTNAYGSAFGEFILPSRMLTGNCRLIVKTLAGKKASNDLNIQVEEYKRPTFEIVFDTLSNAPRSGDSVTATGVVKAYAGYPIANATVNYTLRRTAYYPWWWRRPRFEHENTWEIKGQVKTDAEGRFEVTFFAEAPLKNNNIHQRQPLLFLMDAHVTDLTGETQSATWQQPLSEQEIFLSVDVPENININKIPKITITARNINDKPQSVFVEVEWFHLPNEEPRLFTPEFVCDTMEMSRMAFEKHFPSHKYPVSERFNITDGAELLWKATLKTDSVNGKSVLPELRLHSSEIGLYALRIRTYKGEKMIDEVVTDKILCYSDRQEKNHGNLFLGIHTEQQLLAHGDTLKFAVFSGAKDFIANVVLQIPDTVFRDRYITIYQKTFKLSQSQKFIRVPVFPAYKDRVIIHAYGMKFGKLHSIQSVIPIQHREDISLHWSSFRSDLFPGGQEEWTLEIKPSAKIQPQNVELLATLYDRSLDIFKKLTWQIVSPNLYHSHPTLIREAQRHFYITLHHFHGSRVPYTQARFVFPAFYSAYPRFFTGFAGTRYALGAAKSACASKETTMEVETMLFSGDISDVETESLNAEADVADSENILSGTSFRKNFQETAFFFPQLHADSAGMFHIRFTVPESLTQWQFKALAHDKTMNYGLKEERVITSKQIMAHVNAPRFLREEDTIRFAASVYNNSEQPVAVSTRWQFTDLYGNPMEGLVLETSNEAMTLAPKETAHVFALLAIPQGENTLTYRFMAHSRKHSDGEEKTLPILSNRMLVTETMPMYLHEQGEKNYTFHKLLHHTSPTLTSHTLTVEYTSQPLWNAVLSLPYLIEYPHECNEQTFSCYYANALSQHILKQNPIIPKVLETWRQQSPETLNSPLEKNQELKQILIQETPWYNDSRCESDRRASIARLLDNNAVNERQQVLAQKLVEGQNPDGGFPWFQGGHSSFYITGVVLGGYGRLQRITGGPEDHALPPAVISEAIHYLDREQGIRYEELTRLPQFDPHKKYIYPEIIYYLYARSFFTMQKPQSPALKRAFNFWTDQAVTFGMQETSLYMRALLATTLYRMGKDDIARLLVSTLKQNLKETPEMGLFPIKPVQGYLWHQAPIETQSALIETFDEVTQDTVRVRKLQTWLLQNKRTTHWGTTKSTVDAVYALLIRSRNLQKNDIVTISVGGKPIPKEDLERMEAGTGYIKSQWHGEEITQQMAEISLSKHTDGASWGAAYWQYFEDLDNITSAETGMKITKRLYIVSEDKKVKAASVNEQTQLRSGQRVRVVITMETDRSLEYVHLKDLRAAGLEPIFTPSRHYYQGDLVYYQNIQDAAVNFFIENLPKGIHVFEYDLRVANSGNCSNGITTLQCMYAPEFTAYTKGIRLQIDR